VIPDPIIHISESSIRGPSLPCLARGFAFAVSIQNERVGLGTGRLDGRCSVGGCWRRDWCVDHWLRGISGDNIVRENPIHEGTEKCAAFIPCVDPPEYTI
jgi:hypothetical protein